ncbi:MAG: hypothetical protein R3C32_04120 [Chloroflexota bacterium]
MTSGAGAVRASGDGAHRCAPGGDRRCGAAVRVARRRAHSEVGCVADLLLVDGDPLADVRALRGPRLVVAGSRVIHSPGRAGLGPPDDAGVAAH